MGFHPGLLTRSALAGVCSLFLLALVACGGGDDSTGTEASTPTEARGTRVVTLPGTEADPQKALLGTGEIPEGFPDDIPSPPESEPRNAMIIPNQGGLVTFVSQSSRADVFAHYKSEMSGQGWTVETEEDDLRSMLKAKKGKRTANVTVATGPDGTEVAVTFEGV
ncbi:MAG: hypothetical protein ACQGVC_21420 [Myxococcota bacterium]